MAAAKGANLAVTAAGGGPAGGKAAEVGTRLALNSRAGKAAKKKWWVLPLVASPPLTIIALTVFMAITATIGMNMTDRTVSAAAAADDGLPHELFDAYVAAEDATGVPWQLTAAVAYTQTDHGRDAGDGEEREDDQLHPVVEPPIRLEAQTAAGDDDPEIDPPPESDDTEDAEDGSETGGGDPPEGEEGAAPPPAPAPPAATTTDDITRVGPFLIDEAALNVDDANTTPAAARFIAETIDSHIRSNGFSEDLAFEEQEALWVAALDALPVRGAVPDTEGGSAWAKGIYRVAAAWMVGDSAACGSSTSGWTLTATNGPINVGDLLAKDGRPMTAEMMTNAQEIIAAGLSLGVPTKGLVIAIITALQESGLGNLDYGDRDSLGLFQQRPSTGWGTPEQVRNPTLAAKAFFGRAEHTSNNGLLDIAGWEDMEEGAAAQAVQASAHPTLYSPWIPDAEGIVESVVDALGDTPAASGGGSATSATGAGPVFVLGDSLTVGVEQVGLSIEGRTVTIDAAGSRNVSQGIAILESGAAADAGLVVVALGTNNATESPESFGASIDAAMAAIGDTPTIWVNVDANTDVLASAVGVNDAIAAAAERHPNLTVADWDAHMAGLDNAASLRQDDGVHYTAAGYTVRSEWLARIISGSGGSVTSSCSGGTGMVVADGEMAWPCPCSVSSVFGWRIHPISGDPKMHTGVDLVASPAPMVTAANAGTVSVRSIGQSGGYGNLVILNHGNGLSTYYAHLATVAVNDGDVVEAGQDLGVMGTTGNSTGVHLHWEVRVNDVPVEPLDYVTTQPPGG